ncbi:HNH endonuclease [Streptomyces chattanoogensis]|uniref:HNH endonuclease n=1 Tax=Streptomyces chattanoogensis TaxID=66876 RepID=UPI00369522F7
MIKALPGRYAAVSSWHAKRVAGSRGSRLPYKRSDIFARWSGRCCYCDAPAEHLDHVQPISRGGTDIARNLVPACAACNLSKSDLTLSEWSITFQAIDSLDPERRDQLAGE